MELASFEELVEQYTPMIQHMIKKLSIYKNQGEFFQIGLISIWETTHTFQPEKGKYRSYLYRHMWGRFVDELKKQTKEHDRYFYPEEAFWGMIESPILYAEEEYTIRQLCKPLTECQTKWVIYTMIDQLTVKEIAEKEKVTPSAVKGWKKGAVDKLRLMLGESK